MHLFWQRALSCEKRFLICCLCCVLSHVHPQLIRPLATCRKKVLRRCVKACESAVQKIKKLSETPGTVPIVAKLCMIECKNRKIAEKLVGEIGHFQSWRQGSPRVSKVQGEPQGWVRWVITRSIIFKSFSYMIFKIGPFPHWNSHKFPLKTAEVRGNWLD